MHFRNIKVLLFSVVFFIRIDGIKTNHLSRGRSRMQTHLWHRQRQILSDTILRNSVLYESIILELMRRRLGLRRQNVNMNVPRTVSLPTTFMTTPKPSSVPVKVTPSPEKAVPERHAHTRMSQRRSRLVGTPLELMTPFRKSVSSTSKQNQRNPTRVKSSSTNTFNNRRTSSVVKNNRPSRTFDGVISMNKHGGFEFQTPSGVKIKMPHKSGKLVIRHVTNGVEVNYVTPRPRMREEEMEFEL